MPTFKFSSLDTPLCLTTILCLLLPTLLCSLLLHKASVLCIRLLPLQAQGNEELVRLQVDADTGDLRLVDMFLNLELFLVLAIDRRTACVTH